MSEPRLAMLEVNGSSVQTATWGTGQAQIVLLHDGLGSITQWRGVPAMIAEDCGTAVMAFDRPGHGRSTPVPSGPWPVDWLHTQAVLLASMLDQLRLDGPLLVGHSDGGSISLIHAATAAPHVSGVVALAAHSYVEPICVEEITAMRARAEPIMRGLSRHHEHPAAVFEAWSGVWVDETFARWDIRADLARIDVPVVVAQGADDEYGTDAMAIDTAAAIGPNATCELVAGVGHLMHHEAPEAVVELVRRAFVER